MVKNLPANAGDTRDPGLIPESGIFSAEGHGNPLQYSHLENPMDRRAWKAIVHGAPKESDMTEHTHRDRLDTWNELEFCLAHKRSVNIRINMLYILMHVLQWCV